MRIFVISEGCLPGVTVGLFFHLCIQGIVTLVVAMNGLRIEDDSSEYQEAYKENSHLYYAIGMDISYSCACQMASIIHEYRAIVYLYLGRSNRCKIRARPSTDCLDNIVNTLYNPSITLLTGQPLGTHFCFHISHPRSIFNRLPQTKHM